MPLPIAPSAEDTYRRPAPLGALADATVSLTSAVSWSAVLAGAAAAASLSLVLLILGVGLGLSSVSPWRTEGIGAANLGMSTILWLTLTQLLASAMGGYLAGRLRTRWSGLHTDEVYFRDTAHGFLAWAVSSLATAALLTSVIASILGGGLQAGAAVAGDVAGTAGHAAGGAMGSMRSPQADADAPAGPMGYLIDTLFRRDAAAMAGAVPASTPEAGERGSDRDAVEIGRILMNAGRSEPLPPEDIRHIGQIVAQRTGLPQADAEKRVVTLRARVLARLHDADVAAREAADKARKASAYGALWFFVALLVGAFVASLSATFGGRRRDA